MNIVGAGRIFTTFIRTIRGGSRDGFAIASFIHPIVAMVRAVPVGRLLIGVRGRRGRITVLVSRCNNADNLISVRSVIRRVINSVDSSFRAGSRPRFVVLNRGRCHVDTHVLVSSIGSLFNLSVSGRGISAVNN